MHFFLRLNQSLLVTSTVALLCLLNIIIIQRPLIKQLINKSEILSKDTIEKDSESEKLYLQFFKKTPTFGFNNLIADWVLLRFNQYFGDDAARQQTGYALSPDYFEIIVERDPRFLGAYIPLSTSISLYAGSPQKSIALMEKGLNSMSAKIPEKSYYVWRYKAIDELLFLENVESAQHSFKMTAQWASTYSDPESQNVATISHRTAQFLAGDPDIRRIRRAQETAWATILVNAVNTNDKRTAKLVITQIEMRGGSVKITPQGAISVQLPLAD